MKRRGGHKRSKEAKADDDILNKESSDDASADESSNLVADKSLDKSVESEHHHKHEPVLELIEKICFLVIWPLDKVMPV